jgi:hypothetical protein
MQIAIRPFLMTGLAFGGAAMVALTPIKPNLPDIQMPAIATPALELAALPSYIKWVQEGTEAETKNIPSWQQSHDPELNGALSAAVELGSSLFQHFLTTAAEMPAGGDIANSPAAAPQTPQEFINTVQAVLTDPNFLPTIMDDLVQVVQTVATNTVEPVLDLVLRVTFSTLYRAANIMKATFRDVPAIAATTVDAGGQIIQSLVSGLTAVGEAAMTDPLTILDVLTDRVLNVGAVIADQAIRVIDAFDTYRKDLESALLTPPNPTTPSTAGSAAALESAPAVTLADRAAADIGSRQVGGYDTAASQLGGYDTAASQLGGYDTAANNAAANDGTQTGGTTGNQATPDERVTEPVAGSVLDVDSTPVADVTPTNPSESAAPTRNPGVGQSNKPNRPSINDASGPSTGKTGSKAGARPHSANR